MLGVFIASGKIEPLGHLSRIIRPLKGADNPGADNPPTTLADNPGADYVSRLLFGAPDNPVQMNVLQVFFRADNPALIWAEYPGRIIRLSMGRIIRLGVFAVGFCRITSDTSGVLREIWGADNPAPLRTEYPAWAAT